MKTIYITIGNSDDKLIQAEWAAFHLTVHDYLTRYAKTVHGTWVSGSTSYWQNACWCVEVTAEAESMLRNRLVAVAREYRQDSIAWAEAQVEFIGAAT